MISAPLCQWSSVLSGVVLEQERMLPILLDLLDTNNDTELRPLTGLLRNLARHSTKKDQMGMTYEGIRILVLSGLDSLYLTYLKRCSNTWDAVVI